MSCLLLVACGVAVGQAPSQGVGNLMSPDGQLAMRFGVRPPKNATGPDGALVYAVSFHGKPVMNDSAMALELEDGAALGAAVHLVDAVAGHGVDDYVLANQKVSKVHDAYNSLTLRVVEGGGLHRALTVEARAYNGGVAFRYLLPESAERKSFALKQEDTEFRLSDDATDWLLELPDYRSAYEGEYIKLPTMALRNAASDELIGLPLLMHEPGVAWMALVEADLEGNSSMYVTGPGKGGGAHYFVSKLAPNADGPGPAVQGTLPHHSAWRVLLVADEPGRLVESTLQYDLNPPSRLTDVSYIHAGKSMWDWWVNSIDANGKPTYTNENMKRYIDFCAASGFLFFELDEGWSTRKDILNQNGRYDVPELVRYAKTKGVQVWLWAHSDAVRDQMEQAFPMFEKWGVAGLKIDFINRDDQKEMQFYYDVAKLAAEHHLMVDFHGAHTPWGMERTYPNVMSFEGILGLEQTKSSRRDNPAHRATLPFTRLISGPMDYTPGGFNNVTEEKWAPQNTEPMVLGTRAQQLATYVLFQTPFMMVSDAPQTYEGKPEFQFIKDVPVAWDEIRVLNGVPGEYATIARRSGTEWDLGSLTDWHAREIPVPLSFLGAGTYIAQIYEDAPDAGVEPTHVVVRTQTVKAADTLTLKLATGGGAAVRFVPKGKE